MTDGEVSPGINKRDSDPGPIGKKNRGVVISQSQLKAAITRARAFDQKLGGELDAVVHFLAANAPAALPLILGWVERIATIEAALKANGILR